MSKKGGTNRRDFLKKMGLMGAAGAGSMALGKQALAADPPGGGQEIYTVDDSEKGEALNLYVWSGYDADNVVNPFRKRYGCKVTVELLTSDPDAIMKLKAGATNTFDIITLNNCWSKGMYDDKLIIALDEATFRPYFDKMPSLFKWPFEWAMSDDGKLIGMPQRYGTFNLVINNKKISTQTAQQEAWQLPMDPKNKGRWALVNWDNWVLYHMCQSAGVYPFKKHTEEEMAKVEEAAFKWFENCKFVTESDIEVNNALLAGEIDWYMPGGTYTASAPRAEGHWEIEAISPRVGSLKGGVGSVMWIELTNIINNPRVSPLADDYLAYMQEPEASYNIAIADNTHNAVANMADPKVMSMFSKDELKSIQWDTFEEDISYSDYYQDNPDYKEMMRFYRRAKAAR